MTKQQHIDALLDIYATESKGTLLDIIGELLDRKSLNELKQLYVDTMNSVDNDAIV
jgi:hypothetical protein